MGKKENKKISNENTSKPQHHIKKNIKKESSSKVKIQLRRSKTKQYKRKTDWTSKPKTLKFSSKDKKKSSDKKKTIADEEDEIYYIETEGKLLQDKNGYYTIKKDEELINPVMDEWNDEENEEKIVNLHDLITEKLNENENLKYDEKTIKGFKDLGEILSKYTSGKLPKLLSILPTLVDWKDLIQYTRPFNWTPNAMYETTCIFASNLNNFLIESYYKDYLVPYVRLNIRKYNKLNIHLYNSLKKAIYKPAGFFKGVVFPIAENLTSKEANIIGSIIQKCSIPFAHSSSALIRLCELNGTERISHGHFFFIKLLLSKKYALPSMVKVGIVDFLEKVSLNSGLICKGTLPVIYHQTLLALCQFYKFDLTDEEKNKIRSICNRVSHHSISELVLKEINYKRI